jgi:hypothetical protein
MQNANKSTMPPLPIQAVLTNQLQYHIIPAIYPPLDFFEGLVDSTERAILEEIESLTNERLRQDAGDIFLVPPADRVAGPGASILMAAFTHRGKPSRFTDGSFGIYYASLTQETAITETIYHRSKFLAATHQAAGEITMRVYQGCILQPLHDIRSFTYRRFHHLSDYRAAQKFGKRLRATGSWGLIYPSVRQEHGQCIAAFRPAALSIPRPLHYLRYVWDSQKIIAVFKLQPALLPLV